VGGVGEDLQRLRARDRGFRFVTGSTGKSLVMVSDLPSEATAFTVP